MSEQPETEWVRGRFFIYPYQNTNDDKIGVIQIRESNNPKLIGQTMRVVSYVNGLIPGDYSMVEGQIGYGDSPKNYPYTDLIKGKCAIKVRPATA